MFCPLLLATLLYLSPFHASLLLHLFLLSSISSLLHLLYSLSLLLLFTILHEPFLYLLALFFYSVILFFHIHLLSHLFSFFLHQPFFNVYILTFPVLSFPILLSPLSFSSLLVSFPFFPLFPFHPALPFSISSHSLSGGMPPTPQTVQIGGQNQNQQQYDPSKGPPVQNAASLHTPPPQLPSRLPQATLPMAALPLALSQAQPVVLEQQCQTPGGQLQAQVKLQGAGAVLTAVNPHPQLQMQLQIQQQQTQPVMQPGQAVSKDVFSSPI